VRPHGHPMAGKGRDGMTPQRDDLDPWEQQPGESSQAFEGWAKYRDMVGRRSCYKVAVTLAKSGALVRRWSSVWGWIERARLYDTHLDRETRRENEQRILQFRRRAAAQAAGKAQTLMMVDSGIAQRLQSIAATGGTLQDALAGIDLGELIALSTRGAQALPQLIRAEALALGDSTERPDIALTAGTDDLLTRRIRDNDELRSLAAGLVQKASGGDTGPPA